MIPKQVFEQTLLQFLEPIRPYLEDDRVSEVMINGPEIIFVEKGGRIERTQARFSSHEALLAAIRNIAQYVGRSVDEARPILEARLADGSRVEAILPPVAPDGPHVAIRKFFREALTIQKLLEFGSLTQDAADFLAGVVGVKQNVIVAGGTGSGKTSMLNVLANFFDPKERIVVIEDSREVQIRHDHVVQLEARPADAKGQGAIAIRDLFKATLRMRPDRIVIGEIRGSEALDLVQAMTSGHGGCLATVHATYPHDTLHRLETMAMMSDVQLPLDALRAQVASAVDMVVQTARLRDGARCVTHIAEVQGYTPGQGYHIKDMFHRRYEGAHGERSTLVPTGALPECKDLLKSFGFELPASMYEASVGS